MDDDKEFYKAALGIIRGIPSEETLRQRMDDIGESLRQTILEENVNLLLANRIEPTALPNGLVPVDIDVTPMSKEPKHSVISITEEGNPVIFELKQAFNDYDEVWFRNFSEDEIGQYLQYQKRMNQNLSRILSPMEVEK